MNDNPPGLLVHEVKNCSARNLLFSRQSYRCSSSWSLCIAMQLTRLMAGLFLINSKIAINLLLKIITYLRLALAYCLEQSLNKKKGEWG